MFVFLSEKTRVPLDLSQPNKHTTGMLCVYAIYRMNISDMH